jgi:hypothetical protein
VTEVDAADLASLNRLFGLLDPWLQRTDPTGADPEPEPGSSLQGDNRRTDPHQLSHAAWHALMSSVHHLDAFRRLVRDSNQIPLFAPFSLLRSSLEAGSTAVWLLQPSKRSERVRRRLKLAAQEAAYQDEVAAVFSMQSRRPLADRRQELFDLGSHYGIDPGDIAGRFGYQAVIEEAGRVTGVGSGYAVAFWQLGSGVAHGLLWATLSLMDREEIRQRAGVVGVKVTPSVKAIATFTAAATLTVQHGWKLYDTRSGR